MTPQICSAAVPCTHITKSSYDKMWASIIRKMNTAAGGTKAFPLVDDLTAHIFRHNYCTQLCYKVPEISIKKIAQLMGDTIAVVLNVYNHIVEEKENVADAVSGCTGYVIIFMDFLSHFLDISVFKCCFRHYLDI